MVASLQDRGASVARSPHVPHVSVGMRSRQPRIGRCCSSSSHIEDRERVPRQKVKRGNRQMNGLMSEIER